MRKKISIVIPTYNEEANVVPLSKAVIEVMERDLSEYDYEILFIDNHSKDNTQALLRGLCANNKKIKAIFNAKNFGQARSPVYGMKQAYGDCVVRLTADFQDPVDMIPNLSMNGKREQRLSSESRVQARNAGPCTGFVPAITG